MLNYLKRLDGVRPGRTPLQSADAPVESDAKPSFVLDMNAGMAEAKTTSGVGLALLRRKSDYDGRFGHVYFVEKRLSKEQKKMPDAVEAICREVLDDYEGDDDEGDAEVPGTYALYGGRLEFNPKKDQENEYETTKDAVVRELQEETGLRYGTNVLYPVISGFTEREGEKAVGVEVFIIHEDVATKRITKEVIEKYQKACRAEANELDNEIIELHTNGSVSDRATLVNLCKDRLALQEKVSAGPPVKIRYFKDRWIMLSRGLLGPPWKDMSPLAAYALLADASFMRWERAKANMR